MTPTARNQQESKDSIGIGKISEGQLKAVLEMVKRKNLLREPAPEPTGDRGIVISAGGKYADWGLVNAKWTREHQQVQLPIQVWHLGPEEIPSWMRRHFYALDVELVDAFEVRRTHWHRQLKGWSVKQYGSMRCPWQHVLSLDADAFITKDPAFIFDDWDYQQAGALFCADVAPCRKSNWAHVFAGVPVPEQEMESGYFMWDRTKAWEGIKMVHWIAEHAENWDKMIYGDKSRPELGFGTTNTPYVFASEPRWQGWGIEHFWKEQSICWHGMAWKRKEHTAPSPVLPRLFEWVRSLH